MDKGTYEYFLNFYQKQIYMHGEQKKNTNTNENFTVSQEKLKNL